MITVACVQVGNYCGQGREYVHRLRNGVVANLAEPFRFVCITDIQIRGMDCIAAEPGLEGWWQKLALFKPGQFEGKVLYFDLDTVVEGDLAPLAHAQTEFAMLSDLYHPERLASGVMMWRAGAGDFVWEEYVSGVPLDHRHGDGGYIEAAAKKRGMRVDRLQDLVSGIYSYKVARRHGKPETTRVCCFHGRPRPHETSAWGERA